MHGGGSSSSGRFHQSQYTAPDAQPRVQRMEFGRLYRELAYLYRSLMRVVLSKSLEFVQMTDSLVVNLCSRTRTRGRGSIVE
jgi:hypothetical protein